MQRLCPVCGIEFDAKGTQVYCSPGCRRKIRQEYFHQRYISGVKSKCKVNEAENAERKANIVAAIAENRKRLKEKAEAGDLFSMAQLAMDNGDPGEYWRLRREWELSEEIRMGELREELRNEKNINRS